MSYDPPILMHKSTLMQRIGDYVRMGYIWHISGIVSLHKARTFVRMFSSLYLVHLSKDERYRRKRAGLGNATLLLWQPQPPHGSLAWYLLVSDGDHPAHTLERLKQALDVRIECTGYELVQLPKPGYTRPVWTWRMNRATYTS